MSRLNKVLVAFLLFAFLVIPLSQVARAQEPAPVLKGLFGIAKTVTSTALTMETRAAPSGTTEVQLAINPQTRIMAPPVQVASTGYIHTGDRVAVLASASGQTYTALQIVVIPAQPVKKHIQGMVMDVTGAQVTLIATDGRVFVVQLAQGVTPPSVGQFIVATVEVDSLSNSTSGGRLLTYEVADKILERLEKIIGKGKDVQKLEELLNKNADRHLQVLERALEKAPPQARPSLAKVIEKAKEREKGNKGKTENNRGKDKDDDDDEDEKRQGPPGQAGDAAAGKIVYDNFCAACHGQDAAFFKKEKPPAQEIKKTVRAGERKEGMPAFSPAQISESAIENLIAYLDSIGGVKAERRGPSSTPRPVPTPTPTPTPTPAPSAPQGPTGLTATAASTAQVNLTWVDNANNESGFRIERSTTTAFTANLVMATAAANISNYSDITVTASTAYHYRLFAFNAAGDSPTSNTASVTTPAP